MIWIVCQGYIVAVMVERENGGSSVHHLEGHLFDGHVDGRVVVECDQSQLFAAGRFVFV